MSENLSLRISSLSENGIELHNCSCIVILGSTILTASIPTTIDLNTSITNVQDEEILSILIKQDGQNIVKSFIPIGSLRKDRHYKVKLEPLGVKAEIGSTFTLDAVFTITKHGEEIRLETKSDNPFQQNLYRTEATYTAQDFYSSVKSEDLYVSGNHDAKLGRYGVVPIETQSITYYSPPTTSPHAFKVHLESIEVHPRDEVPELRSQTEVNNLIQELRSSMEILEKNIESKASDIHYELENATLSLEHEHETKNFAQSAPIYTAEEFQTRVKGNYSPEFGNKDFHYTEPGNIQIFSDHQAVTLKVPEARGSHQVAAELHYHQGERQTSILKNTERRSSRHFVETARSVFEDVKIEKNETYLLTLKNQMSSKHIAFINDAFTRDVILYMAQSKKKVSPVYLKRSITIRNKEEVDIDKNEYFNANCVSKYIHFFQPDTKTLCLYNLAQPSDYVDEAAKKVTLNINHEISPFHKSVITPAGMIFIASANSPSNLGSNTFHVYNYKQHSLVEKPFMLCETRKEFGLCYMSKNVFAIGGVVDGVISNRCERYDIRANKWIKIAPMTRPLREVAICSFNNRYLYRFFGIDSGNNIDHSIERYDAVRDTWTIMNVPLNENSKEIYLPFCTQVNKDCIFVFGGRNMNGFSPKSCHGWVLKVEDKRGSNNGELVETKNFIPGLAGTFNANSLLTHAGDIIFLRESY